MRSVRSAAGNAPFPFMSRKGNIRRKAVEWLYDVDELPRAVSTEPRGHRAPRGPTVTNVDVILRSLAAPPPTGQPSHGRHAVAKVRAWPGEGGSPPPGVTVAVTGPSGPWARERVSAIGKPRGKHCERAPVPNRLPRRRPAC
eukprot:364354-Chlamydomonas_euryale.AAC.7